MESMTEDEFDEKVKLIQNTINPDSSWNGCMFETSGKELEFIRSVDPKKVFTWIDGEDSNNTFLVSGLHLVNRIGYLVAEKPFIGDVEIEIK